MVSTFLLMLFLLFGGFLLSESHIPWYATWIVDLSFVNYVFEALAVNEFSDPSIIYTFKGALRSASKGLYSGMKDLDTTPYEPYCAPQ